MNYELEIQKSTPSVFNALNGGVPPLVAGSGSATFLSTTPTAVTFNAWIQYREGSPFSAEVWYLPVNVSAETVVLGHTGEGILFDGSDLILRVKYSSSTTIEGRWSPTEIQNWHLMLVYTTSHWILYVNGEEVITLDAPGSLTLLNTATTVSLNSGPGTGIYDSLALYYRTLVGSDARAHFLLGKTVKPSVSIAASKSGTTWALTYDNVDTLQRFEFDLSNGYTTSTAFADGRLVSLDVTGGGWQTAIPLSAITGTTTAGVHLTYEGHGVVLSYSLDGSTWVISPNKTTILEDASAPGMIFIKLTLANDNSWVSSLRADVLNTRSLAPFIGPRQLVFKGAALDQTPGIQLDYQTDQGAQLRNGYLEIQADIQTTPTNVAAVEAWIRFDGTAGRALAVSGTQFIQVTSGNLTATGITMYRNGALLASGQSAQIGQWNHYVFVLSTPVNTPIRLGDNIGGGSPLNMSVGHLASYSIAQSVTEIQNIYNFNIGAPAVRVDDVGVVGMSESNPGVDIYAYTWSIVSGGH